MAIVDLLLFLFLKMSSVKSLIVSMVECFFCNLLDYLL